MFHCRWLLPILLPYAALAQDEACSTYVPPADGPFDEGSACDVSGRTPDLSATSIATCHDGCNSATRQVWTPIANLSDTPATNVLVSVFRVHGLGRSLVYQETLDVPAHAVVVPAALTLTELEWGEALEATVHSPQGDCDPTNNRATSAAWNLPDLDVDSDGYASLDCGGLDCDDTDDTVHPGAPESPADGRDTNCDGTLPPPTPCDLDNDGVEALWCGGNDCNDADASISPDAEEVPNDGIDNNCSGEDACPEALWVQGGRGACSTGSTPLSGALFLSALLLTSLRRKESHHA